jgi:hypothetical protein
MKIFNTMNTLHYRFSETALPVNEIRKTKARHPLAKGIRKGCWRQPDIDWQAWWRQAYRLLFELISAAGRRFATLFAFAILQIVNLKRFLMIKEELLAEAFYEAMDSFFVMGTVAEHRLLTEPVGHQNFASSGERALHVSVAARRSNAHYFGLTNGFNKNVAEATKTTRWTNEIYNKKIKSRQGKFSKLLFWKKWINNATEGSYHNIIMHLLKIQSKTAHLETGTAYLKC